MRPILICLFAASFLVPISVEARQIDNHYARWHLGQPYGYRDLQVAPGRWRIRGLSMEAGSDFTVAVALQRAAIHAKAEGFSHFYAVSLKIQCTGHDAGYGSPEDACRALDEEVDLVAVGYNDEHTPPRCEQTGRLAANCRAFSVEGEMATAGSYLKLTKEQQDVEVADVRASLGAR
jgi:hypothetical protein